MQTGHALASTLRRLPLHPALTRSSFRTFTPQSRLLRVQQQLTFSTRSLPSSWRPRTIKWPTAPLRRIRNNSSKSAASAAEEQVSKPAQTLRERFKELSRKYGWAAVGVYFGLSALDFPFCFLAVRLIGPDRIGEVEHAIVSGFWSLVGVFLPSMKPKQKAAMGEVEEEAMEAPSADVKANHKVKEDASIWTQLLLAYGVHKSLIFFRIPLTAAVTPKIVKTLRSWGWNIGPRVKAAKVPKA